MTTDAFVIRIADEDAFTSQFLASPDFTVDILKGLVRRFHRSPKAQTRTVLVDELLSFLQYNQYRPSLLRAVIEELLTRERGVCSFKVGTVRATPQRLPIEELVTSPGQEQWYGPVRRPNDEGTWYVRPSFLKHWEYVESEDRAYEFSIRWLCFARVTTDAISLHWRGFSYAADKQTTSASNKPISSSQFPYWEHIPEFFREIEEITNAQVEYAQLHNLVLYQLWDKYIDDPNYQWTHRRIRATSGGVSLSAHAGGVFDMEAEGILHLASTIRKSVVNDLRKRNRQFIPDPEQLDSVILRTLIREYGALSYEFSLERGAEKLFRSHCYFGQRNTYPSADNFPHLQLFTTTRSDIEQLQFLLDSLRESVSDANAEPEQSFLF